MRLFAGSALSIGQAFKVYVIKRLLQYLLFGTTCSLVLGRAPSVLLAPPPIV